MGYVYRGLTPRATGFESTDVTHAVDVDDVVRTTEGKLPWQGRFLDVLRSTAAAAAAPHA